MSLVLLFFLFGSGLSAPSRQAIYVPEWVTVCLHSLPRGFEGTNVTGDRSVVCFSSPSVDFEFAVAKLPGISAVQAVLIAWQRLWGVPPAVELQYPTAGDGIDFLDGQYVSFRPDIKERAAWGKSKCGGDLCYVLLARGHASEANDGVRFMELDKVFDALRPEVPLFDAENTSVTSLLANGGEGVHLFRSFLQREVLPAAAVSGMSVAVVETDQVVFCEGFGRLSSPSSAPAVTSRTQFMIGSVTKSFTTLLISKLAEEGRIPNGWNATAGGLLASWAPSVATAEWSKLSLRKLVTAGTGFAGKDTMFLGVSQEDLENDTRCEESLWKALVSLRRVREEGESFTYQNQLVGAAGLAASSVTLEKALGKSLLQRYERLLWEKVLSPRGMYSSGLHPSGSDVARPQTIELNGTVREMPEAALRNDYIKLVAPAGLVWSNAVDMAKYLMAEIAQPSERHVAIQPITDRMGYGLGFIVGEGPWRIKTVQHSGGTFGFTSHLFFFPTKKVGAVILSNGPFGFHAPIVRKLVELWFTGSPGSAHERVIKEREALKAQLNLRLSGRHDDEKGREFLSSLEGCYISEEYGSFAVKYDQDRGQVSLRCAAIKAVYFSAEEEEGELVAREVHGSPEIFTLYKGKSSGLVFHWGDEDFELEKSNDTSCYFLH